MLVYIHKYPHTCDSADLGFGAFARVSAHVRAQTVADAVHRRVRSATTLLSSAYISH